MDKQIMIVDDDPSIRATVEIVLSDKWVFTSVLLRVERRGLEKLREWFQGFDSSWIL